MASTIIKSHLNHLLLIIEFTNFNNLHYYYLNLRCYYYRYQILTYYNKSMISLLVVYFIF